MKSQLAWSPVLGQYATKMQMVFVDRGKRGAAITKMLAEVEAGQREAGQLVIYPQGTRSPPGTKMPYKVGTAVLYEQLKAAMLSGRYQCGCLLAPSRIVSPAGCGSCRVPAADCDRDGA